MDISKLSLEKLARTIDQTLLKPFVTWDDLRVHCETAIKYHFKTVAVNSAAVSFCSNILKESDVLCDAAISFPLGQTSLKTKLSETKDAIANGAGEVDYVVNLVELKSGNWNYVEEEMKRIVDVCRSAGVTSKVIFENCYLTESEKRHLCEVALKVKPCFIKTSTGFGTGGATLEDVRLMKECAGDELRIKAAGGIRDVKTAMAMLEAGASRLGTSCGVQILEGAQL